MMAKDYPSHHHTEQDSSSSSSEDSDSSSSSFSSSSSSDNESKEGNNGEQENPKAAAALIKINPKAVVIKKRKSVNKKPEAATKKQDKPRKPRKKRKTMEEDDTEETLQLLLQQLNNKDREIPPPDTIVTQIPNEVVEFSRCIFKQLSESDVDGSKCRLVLENKQVKEHFFCLLEESEIPSLKQGVDVLVYGPDGKVYEMKFKIQIQTGTPMLTKGWSKFLKAYKLKKYSDVLKIWMFKTNEDVKICFAIDSIRFDDITKPLNKRILKNVFQNIQETKNMAKDKPRKFVEFEDREETLKLLLQEVNNEDREIPPSNRIVSKIPKEVEFSRCIFKQLTESDLGQHRLMLGKKQVEDHFICDLEESEILGVIQGIDVLVYGPDGKVYEMKFKIQIGTGTPMLTKGWGKFVEAYGLRKYSDVLKIWMFRASEDGKICFVIDSIRFDDINKPLSTRILKNVFKNFQETKNMGKEDSDSSSGSKEDSDSSSSDV